MVLTLSDVGHLLHGTTVGEYVPLTPEPLVTEEIKEPVRGDREPHRRGGAEHDPRWLAGVVDALTCHHPHVFLHIARIQLVPFVHRGGAHPGAEVVGHALRQLQHAALSTCCNRCCSGCTTTTTNNFRKKFLNNFIIISNLN